jgi:drug/metabolite transporter (DMT)-like permease
MTSSPNQRHPPPWALILAFTLVYLCWGTTYLALKKAVREEGLPPALFGGTRICLAGLVVLAVQACRRQQVTIPARDQAAVVLGGVFLFIGGNGLLNMAGQTLDSGVCAVLAATTPLWIGLIEVLWPAGERLSVLGWAGLFVGAFGVAFLSFPELQKAGDKPMDPGYLYVLLSAGCWALGSLIVRRKRIFCSHWTAAAYQMILGGGGLAIVGLVAGEWQRMPDQLTLKAAGAFTWLLIFGSLIGFTAYNWLLSHVPATQVGTYAYVNPAIAVVVGVIDGESATAWLIGGILIILVGVALVRAGQVYVPRQEISEVLDPAKPAPEFCGKESGT